MRQPPPRERIEGEQLIELKRAYKAWSRFAYGNPWVWTLSLIVWTALVGVEIALQPANSIERIFVYLLINVVFGLMAAAVFYTGMLALKMTTPKRATHQNAHIAAIALTVLGFILMILSRAYWNCNVWYNHEVYLCMVAHGTPTRGFCDDLIMNGRSMIGFFVDWLLGRG